MHRVATWFCLLLTTCCIPVRQTSTVYEAGVDRGTTTEATGTHVRLALIDPSDNLPRSTGARVATIEELRCTDIEWRRVRRVRTVTRTPNRFLTILSYVAGVAALAGGVGVAVRASHDPVTSDSLVAHRVGREGAYAIGAGLLAVGLTATGAGVSANLRARDEEEALPPTITRARREERVCGAHRDTGIPVLLLSEPAGPPIARAISSDDGTVRINLVEDVPRSLLLDPQRRSVWLRAGVDSYYPPIQLDIQPARRVLEARLWAAANPEDEGSLREYLDAFPEGEHQLEAQRLLDRLRRPRLEERLERAIADSQLATARRTLQELMSLTDDGDNQQYVAQIEALRERLDQAQAAEVLRTFRQALSDQDLVRATNLYRNLAARSQSHARRLERELHRLRISSIRHVATNVGFRMGMTRRAVRRACHRRHGVWDAGRSGLVGCDLEGWIEIDGIRLGPRAGVGASFCGGRVCKLMVVISSHVGLHTVRSTGAEPSSLFHNADRALTARYGDPTTTRYPHPNHGSVERQWTLDPSGANIRLSLIDLRAFGRGTQMLLGYGRVPFR